MEKKFVIDPLASAYVDASAGSGKTKLLIDRIVRLLLSGIKPSKILCITFTNAAADEMSERLNARLLSFVTMHNEDLYNELKLLYDCNINQIIIEQARSLLMECMHDKPRIETLHSFSAKIINKMQIINMHDNLIQEHSSVLDDVTKIDLIYESFNALIMQKDNIDINNSLQIILKKYNPVYILELITELWNQISNTNQVKYRDMTLNADQMILHIKEKLHQLYNINNTEDIIQEYVNNCDYALLAEIVVVLSKGQNMTSKIAADIIKDFALQKNKDTFLLYVSTLLTADFKPRTRLPMDSHMCKEYPHLKEYLLIQQQMLFDIMEQIHSDASLEVDLGFNIITYNTLKKFHEKKKELRLFEYSDLIHNTIKIINDSSHKMALLYSIDMGLEHILIDEAQDLSEMQWTLIKTITYEFFVGIGTTTNIRTIFIVGDFKQAIFGFQGSAPYIFQQVKKYFRDNVISAGQIWHEIQLDTCYRCAPEILQIVDNVCNENKQAFDLLPEDHIRHHAIANSGYGIVQHHEVEMESFLENQESSQDRQPLDKSWYIAEKISQVIDNWFKDSKKIGQSQKVILPQDIMILLRKRSTLQDHLVSALKLRDIPISNLVAKTFGNSIYIYDLLAVLQFISQPFDRMNLIALLKSHPFNYSDNKIFELYHNRDSDIYSKVKNIELINTIIDQSKVLDLKDFFQWYLDYVYKIENRETVRFTNYIFTYYQITNPFKISIQNFLIWLNELMSSKKQTLYDNNSIRITTVHSAKGLEAPVIIIADGYLSNQLNNNKFIYFDDLCLLNNKYTSRKIKSIIENNGIKVQMENKRLLYVAMTRAKSEVHIFGTEKAQDSWYTMIKPVS